MTTHPSASKAPVRVLEVVDVRVNSGQVESGRDLEAIGFLQEAGFVSLEVKSNDTHVYAKVPPPAEDGVRSPIFFLAFYGLDGITLPVKILRLTMGVLATVEEGYAWFVQKTPDEGTGHISVNARGDHVIGIELTCKASDDATQKSFDKALAAFKVQQQTVASSYGRPLRNLGRLRGKSGPLHAPKVPAAVTSVLPTPPSPPQLPPRIPVPVAASVPTPPPPTQPVPPVPPVLPVPPAPEPVVYEEVAPPPSPVSNPKPAKSPKPPQPKQKAKHFVIGAFHRPSS
jgi:hypothetical protein